MSVIQCYKLSSLHSLYMNMKCEAGKTFRRWEQLPTRHCEQAMKSLWSQTGTNTISLNDAVLLGMFTRVQTNESCVNIWLIVAGHDVAEYCIRGAVWTQGTEAWNAYPLLPCERGTPWLSSLRQRLGFIPAEGLAHVGPRNLCCGTVVLCVLRSQMSDLLWKVSLLCHLLSSAILPVLYNRRIKPFLSSFSDISSMQQSLS